jgi:hypothetical protein
VENPRGDLPAAYRFFFTRKVIEEDLRHSRLEDDIPGLVDYANIPRTVGAAISSGKATLVECETVYSVEDVYLMLEVIAVDAHNRFMAEEWARRKSEER